MRCEACGWDGKEEELVEKQGHPTPDDQALSLVFFMGVTRTDSSCPKCGRVLESRRNMYGLPQPPDYP